MTMRRSDARFIEREVIPFIRQLDDPGLSPLANQARELLHKIGERIEPHDPFDGADFALEPLFGPSSTATRFRVRWEGYVVPYVEVIKYSDDSLEEEGLERGTDAFSICIDDRFGSGQPMTRDEVYETMFLLANGMAVAGGFTSHGPHSFPRNLHGPAVGLAPPNHLPGKV